MTTLPFRLLDELDEDVRVVEDEDEVLVEEGVEEEDELPIDDELVEEDEGMVEEEIEEEDEEDPLWVGCPPPTRPSK